MGKSKPMTVNHEFVWASDNAVNIVFGEMVDIGAASGAVSDQTLRDWDSHAFIGNSIAFTYPGNSDCPPEVMTSVLADVRRRVIANGDVMPERVAEWALPSGNLVSGGSLRANEAVEVRRLLEIVDWLVAALEWRAELEYGATIGHQ